MSLTDRAFIAAYDMPPVAAVSAAAAPRPVATEVDAEAGPAAPHFAPVKSETRAHVNNEKRPLSALLGERKQAAVAGRRTFTASAVPSTPLAGPQVELEAFPWPAIARAIVTDCGEALAGMLRNLVRPLVVVGAQSGAGVTTLTLALALSASRSGREVLVVDGAHQSDLASRLGVASLPELSAATATDDLLRGRSIRSRQDRVTLSVAGAAFGAEHAVRLARPASKQIILIDAGPVRADRKSGATVARWPAWSTVADLVLIDAEPTSSERREAIDALCAAGATPTGVIENSARDVA